MRVTLMAVVAMVRALGIGWRSVIVMRVAMKIVVMAVGVKTRGRKVLAGMSVYANGRGPGELERDDEHDDQGDEVTHAPDFTASRAFAKNSIALGSEVGLRLLAALD